MKKPVRQDVTIDQFPALVIRGFRLNGRMRAVGNGDVCVLGCHGAKGFWVMNLTQGTRGMFCPADLVKYFVPIAEEATA